MPTPPTSLTCDTIRVRGPLDHHEAFPIDSCHCEYCTDCRQAWAAMDLIAAEIARTPCDCRVCKQYKTGNGSRDCAPGSLWEHSRGCLCELCQKAEAANNNVMAAQNRRDLWSEMSWHATHDKGLLRHRLSNTLMEWVEHQLRTRHDTRWWAIKAGGSSMDDWFDLFDKALRSAVVAVTGVALPVKVQP